MSINSTPSTTWRAELTARLKENKRTKRSICASFTGEFLRRSREHLREMTPEEYALGYPKSRDSFCYWLEWQTEALGSVRGGSSAGGCGGVGPTTTEPTPFGDAETAISTIRAAVYCRRCPRRQFGGPVRRVDRITTNWAPIATRCAPRRLFSTFQTNSCRSPVRNASPYSCTILAPPPVSDARRQLSTPRYLRSLHELTVFDTVQMMFFLHHLYFQT